MVILRWTTNEPGNNPSNDHTAPCQLPSHFALGFRFHAYYPCGAHCICTLPRLYPPPLNLAFYRDHASSRVNQSYVVIACWRCFLRIRQSHSWDPISCLSHVAATATTMSKTPTTCRQLTASGGQASLGFWITALTRL